MSSMDDILRDTLNIERVSSEPLRFRITLTGENGITLGRDLSPEDADDLGLKLIAMAGLRNPAKNYR